MSASVFVVDKANALVPLNRAAYDSEDLFQTLLADHPTLLGLAGGPAGKLLLVRREAPVPESQNSGGRWSLDHLFLDREGVPVLVEVKRASDTRTRREVVAQMLDYAANGIAYWPVEQISSVVSGETASEAAIAKFRDFLNGEDADAYWRQVESNLKAGRVRMVFVADEIPKELRRIVEFLNEQMRPAEVLAIEVEQFTGADGLRLLTPRLVGATERAATAKAVQTPKPPLSEEQWLNDIRTLHGDVATANAGRLLDWLRTEAFDVGISSSQDSMSASLSRPDGKSTWPFFVRRSSGKFEMSLQYLKENPAFASEESRLDLLRRIKSLPGTAITTTKSTGWPSVALKDLSDEVIWQGITEIVRFVKARTAEGRDPTMNV